MTNQPSPANQKSLLEEYAAELTPTPGELAAALGPAARKPAGAEPPRRAATAADAAAGQSRNLEMMMRIPVTVRIVLGSATMPVANLVKLGRGAIIPLDRQVGEAVDVTVNGRVVARGEVVVVDGTSSRFGIKLTEVVGQTDGDHKAA